MAKSMQDFDGETSSGKKVIEGIERMHCSWMPDDEIRKIANPTLRRDLASRVREAKEYETRAVNHLERALEQMKA